MLMKSECFNKKKKIAYEGTQNGWYYTTLTCSWGVNIQLNGSVLSPWIKVPFASSFCHMFSMYAAKNSDLHPKCVHGQKRVLLTSIWLVNVSIPQSKTWNCIQEYIICVLWSFHNVQCCFGVCEHWLFFCINFT